MTAKKSDLEIAVDSIRTGLMRMSLPSIEKAIFNDPVTVVIWGDGVKTIVRCQEGDTYDRRTGVLLCCAKRLFGNTGRFNDEIARAVGRAGGGAE